MTDDRPLLAGDPLNNEDNPENSTLTQGGKMASPRIEADNKKYGKGSSLNPSLGNNYVNKIMTKLSTASESMMSSMKKKQTPTLNENNIFKSLLNSSREING